MKRKLVAALLSVAMVASITPVSALGPVASVEAASAAENFKAAMENPALTKDVSQITAATADNVKAQYVTAYSYYKRLSEAEKNEYSDDYATLQAIKNQLIKVYGEEAAKEITKVAKADGVYGSNAGTKETLVSKITAFISKLNELNDNGQSTIASELTKSQIANYDTYTAILNAKSLYNFIDGKKGDLLSTDLAVLSRAINAINSNVYATPEAKKLAANYYLVEAAEAKVQENNNSNEVVKSYTDKMTNAKVLLDNDQTQKNIDAAEALIKEADDALKKLNQKYSADVKGEYDKAKNALNISITAAKTALANKKTADEFTAKVNASELATIELSDMVAVQEIHDEMLALKNNTDVKANIDASVWSKAQNQVADLIKLFPENRNKPNDAFTEAVISAFTVPAAKDVTMADAAQINKAYEVVVGGRLVGTPIANMLNKDLPSYQTAKRLIEAAQDALNTQNASAEKAVIEFGKAVGAFTNSDGAKKDLNDYDYETLLNVAQAKYDALNAMYKEGGSKYNTYVTDKTTGVSYRVSTLYTNLQTLIKNFKEHEAQKTDADYIKQLVAGITALKDKEDLTSADTDAVYALRDIREKLSTKGKAEFRTGYSAYNTKLDAAIKVIDNLVVTDLIKEIDALKQVKPTASLAEIQSAKAANDAARAKYDALTDTQKAAITNYVILRDAEAAVSAAEVQYVKDQMKEIAKLDQTALTLEQAKAIVAIQDIFAGMTDGQKAKVKAETVIYKTYEDALKAAKVVIEKATNLENATITAIADQTYTGEDLQPAVEVKDAFGSVVDASAYKVSYTNNVDAGTAKVVVTALASGNYTGSVETSFTIKAADISKATVSGATKTYTGKDVTTTTKVVVGGKTLTAGTDYEVASYADNKNVGTAKVTITGKGNYAGTATGSFVVKPAKANLTKVTAGTKKATAKYTGQTGASYKVVYAVKGTTKYKAVYSKSLSKAITGLKSGTTYKVKVLAYYKDANGKAYYTGYSNMRTVKVK